MDETYQDLEARNRYKPRTQNQVLEKEKKKRSNNLKSH